MSINNKMLDATNIINKKNTNNYLIMSIDGRCINIDQNHIICKCYMKVCECHCDCLECGWFWKSEIVPQVIKTPTKRNARELLKKKANKF